MEIDKQDINPVFEHLIKEKWNYKPQFSINQCL